MSKIRIPCPGKTRKFVHPVRLSTALALVGAWALRAAEPAVEARGTLVRYDYFENPPQLLERAQFEVVLGGDQCAITVSDEAITEQWVSDGQVSYLVKDYALHLRHAPQTTGTPLLAMVWYGPHVLSLRPFLGVSWLAFSPYPARIQQAAGPTPPWPAFWKFPLKDAYAHAMRWTNLVFMSGLPEYRLLQSLEWVWSVSALDTLPERNRQMTLYLWDWDPDWTRIKEAKRILQQDHMDGNKVASYRVLQTTNFMGLAWPLEFRFEIHGQEKVTSAWHGRVHALAPASPVTMPLWVSKPLQVDDYRFRDEALRLSGIQYFVTNNPWPGTNDPTLRQLFEEQKARALLSQPRLNRGWRLAFAIAVVLLAVLTFPVLVLRWGRPDNKPKPT